MTRNDLAVAVHSLYVSIHSEQNHFFVDSYYEFGSVWHAWFNEAGFISPGSMELKSIRTLASLPSWHLFTHTKSIMTGLSIFLEEGYYGFRGMESAVLSMTTDTSQRELFELLGWFNGAIPEAFQPQDDGTIVRH